MTSARRAHPYLLLCSHCGEAGCAVREALEEGKISQSRYNSYRTLYEEAKQFKEWENR